MKILIVRTFPSIMNIEHYNVQEIGLAKALVREGHECGIVLYNGFHKRRVEEIAVDGTDGKVQVYWLRALNLVKNGVFFGLSAIAKQYDVIQVHEYDQLTSWWYYSFRKQPVVIYHGPYECGFNKGYNLKCKIFDHTFLKLCRRKDVMCLAKSPLAAEFLQKRGFCNVHSVGVGLDTAVYETQEPQKAGSTGLRLLYVGKIEERRNVYFIEKIMRSLMEYPDITLTMVGNGDTDYVQTYLKAIDDLIQAGKIRHIPSVKQQDMGEVYRSHDVLLFPTNYDIFGMVLLEAMYCGMTCISSVNGGASCLIRDGENGIIVEEFDVQSWKTSILGLLGDKHKLKVLKDKNSEYILKNYTWQARIECFVRGYEKVYKMGEKNE